MPREIVFERARITDIRHRNPEGSISSQIKLVAVANKNAVDLIRACWPSEYRLENVRAVHGIKKISLITFQSESVGRFRVFRVPGQDGLMVSFVVQHAGPPFDLLEHWLKIGEAEGVCTLEQRQAEMFEEKE